MIKLIKRILLFFLFLMSLNVIYGQAEYPYDVANATYTGVNFYVGGQESFPQGFDFNANGSKFFYVGGSNDRIYSYSCSENFNLSNCVEDSGNLYVGSQESNPQALVISPDGSQIYILGNSRDRIYVYSCTNPFDLSSCSYSNDNFYVGGQESNPTSLTFNDIGSKIYVGGISGARIFEYDCSINYDVTSCLYNNINFYVGSQDSRPEGIAFNEEGSLFISLGGNNDRLFEYSCSTEFDIGSCSYTNRFKSVSSRDVSMTDMAFNNDGSGLFLIGTSTDRIYQYSIDFVPPVPPISADIQQFYNSSNISILVNSESNTNMSYILDFGNEISICNDCNSSILNLNDLSESQHTITFISTFNDESLNVSYNFTIDTTNIQLSFNNNVLFKNYSANLSLLNMTANDVNFANMTLYWSDNTTTFTENSILSGIKFFDESSIYAFEVIAFDLAGNSFNNSGKIIMAPEIKIQFEDFLNNSILSNYSVSVSSPLRNYSKDINGSDFYLSPFISLEDPFDFGNYSLRFIKDGYNETTFNQIVNSTNGNTNVELFVNPAKITFNIRSIVDGNLTTAGNYTVLVNNQLTGETRTFQIVNNNTLTIDNYIDENTNLKIDLLTGEEVLSNNLIVMPRQDVEIDFYVSVDESVIQPIEVLGADFLPIKDSLVTLYVFIEGRGFVVNSEINTDDVGIVNFNVIPFKHLYNVCNTLDGVTVCLNQITFDDRGETKRIIHSQTLEPNTENLLDNIRWSVFENKTNETVQIRFLFDDTKNVVDSFCIDATRTTNNSVDDLGKVCQDTSSGLLIQTYQLLKDQFITYELSFNEDNSSYSLATINTYPEQIDFNQLTLYGVFGLMFLIIYYGALGLFLRFGKMFFYHGAKLSLILVLIAIQSVILQTFITLELWALLLITTAVMIFTRFE